MESIVDLTWRAYPASAIMALGVALLAHGLRTLAGSFALAATDRERPLRFVSGLRAAIIGAAIGALAGAWIWQQLWLLILALAIGGEELLECSVVMYALRRGRRLEAQAAA